jgi:hypothetical protein
MRLGRPSETKATRTSASTNISSPRMTRCTSAIEAPETSCESVRGQHAAARRALNEAALDQKRLDDVLDRVARLRERRGNRLDADRAAAIVLGDQREIAAVHRVEPGGVDFEMAERAVGDGAFDGWIASHQREIAHAFQQAPRDAWRAARAPGDFVGAVGGD